MAEATFYPSLDGHVWHEQEAGAWSDLVNGGGSGAADGILGGNVIAFQGSSLGCQGFTAS
ncbi:unnamed protein product, partial [marine sediment metagenome]